MATQNPVIKLIRDARGNRIAMTGAIILGTCLLAVIVGPWFLPYDPTKMNFDTMLLPPSETHLFGTDSLGRDTLTRVLYGARLSLVVSVIGVLMGGAAGTLIGMISAFKGGLVDAIGMRFVDLIFAFPIYALGIFMLMVLGGGLQGVILTIAIIYIPNFGRLARNTTMVVKEEAYVQAARLMGQSTLRILAREILPNIAAPMFVQLTVGFAFGIIIEAGLSFLGLGVQPPTVSLGTLIADGKDYFARSPYVLTLTGISLGIIILGLNLVGDGLRDLLDPRMRQRTAA